MLDLGKTCYFYLDLVRIEFLMSFLAPNGCPRLIIIYYKLKQIWDQNNFARVTSEPKKTFKGSISAELVIKTLF